MNFIDLFAGIGGFRLALEDNNTKCVFTSEIDKYAQKTYLANFPGDVMSNDITEVEVNDIPKFDLLCAGFPCQPFSLAGKKLGFDDVRGTMFFKIARILQYHKPEYILFENVPGLLSHDNGNTFKVMLEILNNLRYNVSYRVINSYHFVQQQRKRLYIVGSLHRKIDLNKLILPEIPKYNLSDILEQDASNGYTLSDKMWKYCQQRDILQKSKGYGPFYRVYDKNYSKQVRANLKSDRRFLEQDGKNPRYFTIREKARLSGFPDTFIFPFSRTQTSKQLGNTIVVPVVKMIGDFIKYGSYS